MVSKSLVMRDVAVKPVDKARKPDPEIVPFQQFGGFYYYFVVNFDVSEILLAMLFAFLPNLSMPTPGTFVFQG